jgi:hypothetical protein
VGVWRAPDGLPLSQPSAKQLWLPPGRTVLTNHVDVLRRDGAQASVLALDVTNTGAATDLALALIGDFGSPTERRWPMVLALPHGDSTLEWQLRRDARPAEVDWEHIDTLAFTAAATSSSDGTPCVALRRIELTGASQSSVEEVTSL